MPKAGTPQTPPQAPRNTETVRSLLEPVNVPENASATPPIEVNPGMPVDQIDIKQGGEVKATIVGVDPGHPVDVLADAEKLAAELAPRTSETPKEMIAGTPANPKTMALPADEVSAFALIRSNDGMWRAVQYRIKGATVLQVRTKEPDLKALLAAQITDCLALDMPLFNDEEAPRE